MSTSNTLPEFAREPSPYSFKSVKYFCHMCRKHLSRLVDAQRPQEVFCDDCGAPCEELVP